ncbi:hypothetical protein H0H93_008499 [Arthromyces matolae]|nr:hypothetical protein H0H93_008499 [Arthromyces matolae]
MDTTIVSSQTNSSDYFEEDDPAFLEALATTTLPGDVYMEYEPRDEDNSSQELEPPPASQPSLKRSRLEVYEERAKLGRSETAGGEDIYGQSHFGDYGEYMHRKRAKLQIQNAEIEKETSGGNNIFKGLAIYINGYTQPSIQDLRKLIVQHGGIFQPYLDKKSIVTHIVTCSLTGAKMREFRNMKVVTPEWLVESARQGVLLHWRDFVFSPNERTESTQGIKGRQSDISTSMTSSMVPLSVAPPATPVKRKAQDNSQVVTPVTKRLPQPPLAPLRKDGRNRSRSPHAPAIVDDQGPRGPVSPAREMQDEGDGILADPKGGMPSYAGHTSNPIAARAMANPEWRNAHTSVAPDFIEGYYKNSRLHHLSTWKAELKNLVQEAQERAESTGAAELVGRIDSELIKEPTGVSMRGAELMMKPPSKSKSKGKEKAVDRVIMHCDFDCFFVSAGLTTRPQLKGKPVVVCHSQGAQGGASSTSEIASASYEARSFGIRNGMSLRQARELCPGVITIPYEFEIYKKLSLKFYTILMKHADDLQAVSVDEALIDVSSVVLQLQSNGSDAADSVDPAKDFAERIRSQVRQATGCEARIATRCAKPAKSFHLVPEVIQEVLAPLSITDLHGFGASARQKVQEKLGTTTLGKLMDKSKVTLCETLGKATGENLYNAIRGIDDRKLESDKPRKSVSCEINYGIRFENRQQAETFIYQMAKEVSSRLENIGMAGRSITLRIMKRDPKAPREPPKFLGHGACDLYNKQISLIGPAGRATSDDRVIGEHANRILRSFNFDPKELRGIGIQIQKLEKPSSGPEVQQGMLPFKRILSPQKPVRPRARARAPTISVHPPSDDVQALSAAQSPSKNAVDLPNFSQVDKEVFHALPDDVRKELEEEYQRRSRSPAGPPPLHVPARKNIFPEKSKTKGNDYSRIVRQQRPQNRPFISPSKGPLFKKKARAGASKLSDAALHALNIDPTVFRDLPPNVQHEQLAMLRLIEKHGKIPSPPSQRKILKPRKRKPIPPHLIWIAPPPRARFVAPPILRQQGKEKSEKLLLTETPDIQNAIELWVTTYKKWVPKEKDIEFFTKYLVATVDGTVHGDHGIERGIAIMKWWLVLLRRYWGGYEYVEEDEEMQLTPGNPVGEAWWKIFREIKAKMDDVARKKFGGCLSLK